MSEPPTQASSCHDGVGLCDYYRIFHRSRWLITLVTLLGLALGLAYALLSPPRYTAVALLQLQTDGRASPALLPTTLDSYGVSKAAPEIEVLRSRRLLIPLIEEFGLDIELYPAGLRNPANVMEPRRYIERFEIPPHSSGDTFSLTVTGGNHFSLQTPEGVTIEGESTVRHATDPDSAAVEIVFSMLPPQGRYELIKRSPLGAVNLLREQLKVREKGHDSGVIELQVSTHHPGTASAFLNELMARYLEELKQRNARQTQDALRYVEEELLKLGGQLDSAESALNQYRQGQGAIDLQLEIETLTRRRSELESSLSELTSERTGLSRRYTASHPRLLALDARIDETRQTLSQLENRLRALPKAEQAQEALSREAEANISLYNSLLNSAQSLRVAQRSPLINARVIDPALKPEKPASPNKPLSVVLGLLLGMVLGFAAALTRPYLSPMTSRSD